MNPQNINHMIKFIPQNSYYIQQYIYFQSFIFKAMVSSLQTLLENARKGFAYQLLTLQIDIENNQNNIDLTKSHTKNKNNELIEKLSQLIQLYMLGVQVLQSNGDNRYKYFSTKIQGLMKKKHIIQQLHIASTGNKATQDVMKQANQEQIVDRKNEHEIQVFLNSQQCQIKKIKQLVQQQDKKYNSFKKKVGQNVNNQHKALQQRIKLRRMKSETKSIKNFDIGSNPPDQKERDISILNNVQSANKYLKQGQEPKKKLMKAKSSKNLFYSNDIDLPKRKGSIQKNKKRILDL